jgi:hypothetical protein
LKLADTPPVPPPPKIGTRVQTDNSVEERRALGVALDIVETLRHDGDSDLVTVLTPYLGQVGDQDERDERLGRLVRLLGRMNADVLDNIGKVVPQASDGYITGLRNLANGTD